MTIPYLECFMSNVNVLVAAPVDVAAGVLSVVTMMLHGKPAAELDETIVKLGFDSCKAHSAGEAAERTMAQCQTALYDMVNGLNYTAFQYVRAQFIVGGVDSGKLVGAAEQVWDKQVNGIVKSFDFKRPKSEAKDAVRKAEQAAKRDKDFGLLSDAEIESKVDALITLGDTASLKAATKYAGEADKRNKPVLDAEAVGRKALVEKITARVREIAKAKTADGDNLLTQAALLLG